MKKLIYIFLIFNLQSSICNLHSQWVEQTSGTGAHLYDVEFINQNTGWACGDGGIVIKTTNGGTNWFTQNTGVTSTILTGIHPVNTNTVYAVGYWRTLLKSTNGGTNWQIISSLGIGQGVSFGEVFFIDENTGWWVGTQSTYVFKTTDGMNSIDSFFNVATCSLFDIYFKNSLTGIAASVAPNCVFKTTNGGINWKNILVPNIGCAAPFFQITFADNFTGWMIPSGECVLGRGHAVFRTTNFGDSWDTISRLHALPMTDFYGLFFSSPNTGWVSGSSTRTYKTTNGGFNWIQQVTPNLTGILKLSFASDSIGWGIGNSGKIIYTNTSGQYVNINPITEEIPRKHNLSQNYPNPFNPFTNIKYQIALNNSIVNIAVFDITGRIIKILVNQEQNTGLYSVDFDASELSSGLYFYVLEVNGEKIDSKKMLFIK